MDSVILGFLTSYPKLAIILTVVGGLRLTLKPLFAFSHTFFQAWGLTSYDQKETAVEQSKPVQFIYFLLDYMGSIKVPVPVAAQNVPPSDPPKAS